MNFGPSRNAPRDSPDLPLATDHEHYSGRSYDSERRFASYWNQIDCVLQCKPASVLEVGIGTGLVSDYLKRHVESVFTVDLNAALNPDVVATIEAVPARENAVDVVLCGEVLEHIPYCAALGAMKELGRVARHRLIITVPDATPFMRLILPVPKTGERRMVLKRWWARRPKTPLVPDQHYWELGIRGLPVKSFKADIESVGLSLIHHRRLFGNPYHHLFELEPT